MIELGGLLAGGLGLVEVLGEGVGAGPEVERLASSVGNGVRVSGLGSLALVTVLHLHVGAFGVGRRPDARGAGVSQGHIATCRWGRRQGHGMD